MNIMSFNCCGLVNPSKKLSLRCLIEFNHPDVVLLQETLGLNEDVSCILETLLLGWKFVAIYVCGCFGGLVSGWILKSCRCDGMWSFSSGIGLDLYDAHMGKVLTILNVYGPHMNRVPFWNTLSNKTFVSNWEVILGGDLNFSLGCA